MTDHLTVEHLRVYWHSLGQRIVWCNGCFDILHVGHIRMLQSAKALGDVLVVGLNDDASVRRLKGPGRPVNSEQDRADMLLALRCVDYVSLFFDDSSAELLQCFKPDVYVKGDGSVPSEAEIGAVEAYGGKVVFLPHTPGISTTELLRRLKGCPDYDYPGTLDEHKQAIFDWQAKAWTAWGERWKKEAVHE